MPEEEFLGELAEKTTSVTIKEFTPEGVLISYNLQGHVKGQYEAAHMETVDAMFKPDGTYEFEARGIDQTNDGERAVRGDLRLVHGRVCRQDLCSEVSSTRESVRTDGGLAWPLAFHSPLDVSEPIPADRVNFTRSGAGAWRDSNPPFGMTVNRRIEIWARGFSLRG